MKNKIANLIEDGLDKLRLHTLADRWYKARSSRKWYKPPRIRG